MPLKLDENYTLEREEAPLQGKMSCWRANAMQLFFCAHSLSGVRFCVYCFATGVHYKYAIMGGSVFVFGLGGDGEFTFFETIFSQIAMAK